MVLQATEVELKNEVDRLTDRCTRLDASLYEASSETEKLRVKLLDHQPPKFISDANQPLLQSLQQRIAANKVCCFLHKLPPSAFFAKLISFSIS